MFKILEIDTERLKKECWGRGEEIADLLGITKTSLSRKLHGHQRIFLDELNQIALFLNRSTKSFLREVLVKGELARRRKATQRTDRKSPDPDPAAPGQTAA